MVGTIDIKSLNLEELVGVVNIYPWFGAARKELCERMSKMGAWGESQYAEASLYVGSRSIIAELVRAGKAVDCSDKDLSQLLKTYFDAEPPKAGSAEAPAGPATAAPKPAETPLRQIVFVGGDYFSQSQYENVRTSQDSIFSTFASKARAEGYEEPVNEDRSDFCTETLAEIYLEQGYPEQAKDIYSKLILRYPEKSVYFAALIEKIDNQK